MVMVRICNSSQTEIADLEIASGVEEKIRRLQIAMQNVGRVDVLETPQDLVEEVTDVIIAQSLEDKARLVKSMIKITATKIWLTVDYYLFLKLLTKWGYKCCRM